MDTQKQVCPWFRTVNGQDKSLLAPCLIVWIVKSALQENSILDANGSQFTATRANEGIFLFILIGFCSTKVLPFC